MLSTPENPLVFARVRQNYRHHTSLLQPPDPLGNRDIVLVVGASPLHQSQLTVQLLPVCQRLVSTGRVGNDDGTTAPRRRRPMDELQPGPWYSQLTVAPSAVSVTSGGSRKPCSAHSATTASFRLVGPCTSSSLSRLGTHDAAR